MTRYDSGEEPMVIRYGDGTEVRSGDVYRNNKLQREITLKMGLRPAVSPEWANCTLIRRGETEAEKPGKLLADMWAAQAAKSIRDRSLKANIQALELYAAQWNSPGVITRQHDAPVVLGHDRNGREVRKGDRILAVDMGFVCTVSELHPDGRFAGMSEKQGLCSVPEQHAELVDEKAERRFAVGNVEALGEKAEQIGCVDNSGHVWESGFCRYCRCTYHQAAAIESGVIDPDHFGFSAAGKTAAPIVESFSRWLARPTMDERFEEFKEKVSAALHRFSVFDVAAVTDMTSDGFLMRLRVGESRCDMHCKDDVSWTMVEGFVSIAVASEADRIGRESLKRKEPRQ